MALPVVAVDAVAGIEDALLFEEALPADAVVDEAGHRAERPEHLGILALAGVAGDDDELRGERRVRGQLGLDAESAWAVDRELAEETERRGNPLSLVLEAPADDLLEQVEAELRLGDDAEIAASSAKPPEQLGVLIVACAD